MRLDQYERLRALSEKLMDVFLDEADPDEWPGADVPIANMDAKTRGDRYWSKKNAAATGVLATKVETMIGHIQLGTAAGTGSSAVVDEEKQLDKQIDDAEKEASKLLNSVREKSRKTAFDKKVHGKA